MFVALSEWTDSRCIHCFDLTSSTLVGRCLDIRPNADLATMKSLSLGYELDTAPTAAHQLIMIVDKDKTLLIYPDYSMELVDSV